MSRLDLAVPDDLGRFLAIHHAAFTALAVHAAGDTRADLLDLAARAARDLEVLGRPALPALGARQFDPVALTYVLQGSRLGTKVLRMRWAAGTDPGARRADAYFSAPSHPGKWRDVCEDLGRRPAQGAEADRITRDAGAIFDLFRTAHGLSQDMKGRRVA